MSQPQNNLILFTPGTIIQSAQVNQDLNDIVQLSGNSVGSQLQTLLSNNFSGFVQSGGVLTTASGLTVNMSAAYIVVGGLTYYMPAQSFTVTASKDTYLDFVPGTVPTYQATPASNNAASPALYATNAVRMGIIVSGASSITYNNQGARAATAPTVSNNILAVCDSNGVLIYPNDPTFKTLGYRQITSSFVSSGSGDVAVTGLSLPILIPTGRSVKITFGSYAIQMASGAPNAGSNRLWDGTVGSGTLVGGSAWYLAANNIDSQTPQVIANLTPGVSSKTYNAAFAQSAAIQKTLTATANLPAFILAEIA